MKFECLEDRVLIKPIKSEEIIKSEAGLHLDMKKKETAEGVVASVGNGYTARETGVFVPTVLRKGDKVLYGIGQGMPMDIVNGTGKPEEYILMREGDILMLTGREETKDVSI